MSSKYGDPTQPIHYRNYKEPLTRVKNGHGYYGVICETDNGEWVQCHECGKLVKSIAHHAKAHDMSSEEYRDKYKIGRTSSVTATKTRELRQEAKLRRARYRETAEYKGKSEMYTCQKGHVGVPYRYTSRFGTAKYHCRSCTYEANERYIELHPHKIKAREAVHKALAQGTIEKGTCRDCGATKTQFHHSEGYEKENWLKGVWLCRKCHTAEHMKLRERAKHDTN